MKKNNPFEVHNIDYLSPSSMNTYISDVPMWVARYLFGVKSGSGAGAVRGIVQESVLADKYKTGKFDFDSLEVKYIDTCIEFKLDLEDVKIEKEKKLLKNFGKIIDDNFDYTDLQDYQERVEVELEDMPIPVMGYIDFRFKDKIVDLKTTTRMPSKPTEAQMRQMAFYSMAYPDNSVDLFFATPKDYKKFTLDNLSVYKKQLKKVAFSIQKFLSVSNDRHELASLVYPNYDSWTWGYKLKQEAKKIWS
jgi:hypothetical protein|tara:strand:+ start:6183 stop:6926 length:744 start_codon:yes stop_codon:yes gene_type:complete